MPAKVHFNGGIGNRQSPSERVGLHIQFTSPFLHDRRRNRFGNRVDNYRILLNDLHCIRGYFLFFNYRFRNGNGRRNHLFERDNYHAGVSHTAEETAVQFLPCPAIVQSFQAEDAAVDMLAAMIRDNFGFAFQNIQNILLMGHIRFFHHFDKILPWDISAVACDDAVRHCHFFPHHFFKGFQTPLRQFFVKLVAPFGGGCAAKRELNDFHCRVVQDTLQNIGYLPKSFSVVSIRLIYPYTVYPEIDKDFRTALLGVGRDTPQKHDSQYYTVPFCPHKYHF